MVKKSEIFGGSHFWNEETKSNPVFLFAHLHIGSEGFVCVLEAVPVLSSQSEGYAGEAEGTVFGYLCIHRLRSRWVCHREVLVQQLLGDDILETEGGEDGGDKYLR